MSDICGTMPATIEELVLALMRVKADGTVFLNYVTTTYVAGTSDSYITCDNTGVSLAEVFGNLLTTDADGNLAIKLGKIA